MEERCPFPELERSPTIYVNIYSFLETWFAAENYFASANNKEASADNLCKKFAIGLGIDPQTIVCAADLQPLLEEIAPMNGKVVGEIYGAQLLQSPVFVTDKDLLQLLKTNNKRITRIFNMKAEAILKEIPKKTIHRLMDDGFKPIQLDWPTFSKNVNRAVFGSANSPSGPNPPVL